MENREKFRKGNMPWSLSPESYKNNHGIPAGLLTCSGFVRLPILCEKEQWLNEQTFNQELTATGIVLAFHQIPF